MDQKRSQYNDKQRFDVFQSMTNKKWQRQPKSNQHWESYHVEYQYKKRLYRSYRSECQAFCYRKDSDFARMLLSESRIQTLNAKPQWESVLCDGLAGQNGDQKSQISMVYFTENQKNIVQKTIKTNRLEDSKQSLAVI